jgi:hypothetical protein
VNLDEDDVDDFDDDGGEDEEAEQEEKVGGKRKDAQRFCPYCEFRCPFDQGGILLPHLLTSRGSTRSGIAPILWL